MLKKLSYLIIFIVFIVLGFMTLTIDKQSDQQDTIKIYDEPVDEAQVIQNIFGEELGLEKI